MAGKKTSYFDGFKVGADFDEDRKAFRLIIKSEEPMTDAQLVLRLKEWFIHSLLKGKDPWSMESEH
jgi:hypothetical protein